jgi:hypothetical protein
MRSIFRVYDFHILIFSIDTFHILHSFHIQHLYLPYSHSFHIQHLYLSGSIPSLFCICTSYFASTVYVPYSAYTPPIFCIYLPYFVYVPHILHLYVPHSIFCTLHSCLNPRQSFKVREQYSFSSVLLYYISYSLDISDLTEPASFIAGLQYGRICRTIPGKAF